MSLGFLFRERTHTVLCKHHRQKAPRWNAAPCLGRWRLSNCDGSLLISLISFRARHTSPDVVTAMLLLIFGDTLWRASHLNGILTGPRLRRSWRSGPESTKTLSCYSPLACSPGASPHPSKKHDIFSKTAEPIATLRLHSLLAALPPSSILSPIVQRHTIIFLFRRTAPLSLLPHVFGKFKNKMSNRELHWHRP